MTTGGVVGVVRCGDPDAIAGRFVCGQVRRLPMPSHSTRPPARGGAARRSKARRRSSRRARSPARSAADDDGSEPADAVLKLVRRGRTAIVNLTESQRVALSDPEGQVALSLLTHLLAVRYALGLCNEFPFTERFILRLANRLGYEIGRNAARRVLDRLRDSGVIVPVGSYRAAYDLHKPSGFRVALWRAGPAVHVRAGLRSSAKALPRLRSATNQASVAGPRSRKSRGWWSDPLMGNPEGRPPLHVSRKVLCRWRSARHRSEERRREAEFYDGLAA